MKMSHLFSIPYDEEGLHIFARSIGLRREWYQRTHYDVSQSKRKQAIEAGATPVTMLEGARLRLDDRQIGRAWLEGET
jgi:hypothetical protein